MVNSPLPPPVLYFLGITSTSITYFCTPKTLIGSSLSFYAARRYSSSTPPRNSAALLKIYSASAIKASELSSAFSFLEGFYSGQPSNHCVQYKRRS